MAREVDDDAELSALVAVWRALKGASISEHPRLPDVDGKARTMLAGDVAAEIASAMSGFSVAFDTEADKTRLELARETLDEVKALTEYEDEKATRLLTIVSFLAALAGALFTSMSNDYPLWRTLEVVGNGWKFWLIVATYTLFGAFVVAVVCGALVVFHATQIRFKYPRIKAQAGGALPKSYLFYKEILAVRPSDWARSFRDSASPTVLAQSLDPALATRYFKSYVSESYLVAAKVADKLQYLQPAQRILSLSIKLLLVWFVLAMLAVASIRCSTGAMSS